MAESEKRAEKSLGRCILPPGFCFCPFALIFAIFLNYSKGWDYREGGSNLIISVAYKRILYLSKSVQV